MATKKEATTEALPAPRLGEVIHVQLADGVILFNAEAGADFEPGVPTPQTVTVGTLRRLADGDLVQVAAPSVASTAPTA